MQFLIPYLEIIIAIHIVFLFLFLAYVFAYFHTAYNSDIEYPSDNRYKPYALFSSVCVLITFALTVLTYKADNNSPILEIDNLLTESHEVYEPGTLINSPLAVTFTYAHAVEKMPTNNNRRFFLSHIDKITDDGVITKKEWTHTNEQFKAIKENYKSELANNNRQDNIFN